MSVESLTPLVHELFDPNDASQRVEHPTGWTLAPLAAGREDEPGVADAVDALRLDGATVVLGLSFGATPDDGASPDHGSPDHGELVAVSVRSPSPRPPPRRSAPPRAEPGSTLVVGTDDATTVPAPRRPEPVVEGAPGDQEQHADRDAGEAVPLPGADTSVPATRRTVDREVPGGRGPRGRRPHAAGRGRGRPRRLARPPRARRRRPRCRRRPRRRHRRVGRARARRRRPHDGGAAHRGCEGREGHLRALGRARPGRHGPRRRDGHGGHRAAQARPWPDSPSTAPRAWPSARAPGRPPSSAARPSSRGSRRTPWHVMPAETVLTRLDTTERGLSAAEVARRTREDPAADVDEAPSLGRAFLDELNNPLTPVLAGGAVLSAAIGAVVDAAIVVGVTAASALIGGVQRVVTDRAVAGLLERSSTRARVLRDGVPTTVTADDVVVGDVVELGPDDVVPADCRVLRADALELDESSLTGESLPVTKNPLPVIARSVADRRSMLYEGTTVATGRGRAVVVATGSLDRGRTVDGGRPGQRPGRRRRPAPLRHHEGDHAARARLGGRRRRRGRGARPAHAAEPARRRQPRGRVGARGAAVRRLGRPAGVRAAALRRGRAGAQPEDHRGRRARRRPVLRQDRHAHRGQARALGDLRRRQAAADRPAAQAPAPGPRRRAARHPAPEGGGAPRAPHRPGGRVRRASPSTSIPSTSAPAGGRSRRSTSTPAAATTPRSGRRARRASPSGCSRSRARPRSSSPACTDWAGTPLDDEARQRLVEHTELLAGQGMRVLAVAERVASRGRDRRDADDAARGDRRRRRRPALRRLRRLHRPGARRLAGHRARPARRRRAGRHDHRRPPEHRRGGRRASWTSSATAAPSSPARRWTSSTTTPSTRSCRRCASSPAARPRTRCGRSRPSSASGARSR